MMFRVTVFRSVSESRRPRPFAGLLLACLLGAAPGQRGGVRFDGMTWYECLDARGTLSVNEQGHLVWEPCKPQQLIATLDEPQPVSEAGDVAEFRCLWRSRGQVLGEDCMTSGRHDDDVTCLAGTGDFRFALLDSGGRGFTSGGQGLQSDTFRGWRGYQWRFSPHLKPDSPLRWYEQKKDGSRESHTNLRPFKRTRPDSPSLLDTRDAWDSMRQPFAGGFHAPMDRFSMFVVRIQRKSSSILEISIELGGKRFSVTDGDPTSQPQRIDTLAIQFPNARPYETVVLAPLRPMPGDDVLQGDQGEERRVRPARRDQPRCHDRLRRLPGPDRAASEAADGSHREPGTPDRGCPSGHVCQGGHGDRPVPD